MQPPFPLYPAPVGRANRDLRVAGAILRFRTDLVAYVTMLSLAGYLGLIAWAHFRGLGLVPRLVEVVPFVFSLLILGLIQYFALRRSRASYELGGLRGVPKS